jgi:hypothetical protein
VQVNPQGIENKARLINILRNPRHLAVAVDARVPTKTEEEKEVRGTGTRQQHGQVP